MNFLYNDTFLLESISVNNNTTYNAYGSRYCLGPDQRKYFDFIVLGIVCSIVSLLGIIGNILSCYVLAKNKSSFSCLLLGLAISDAIICVNSIITFGIPELITELELELSSTYYRASCLLRPYIFPAGLTALTCSIYFTICVTIERYIAVTWPIRARSLCTWGKARAMTIFILIFSVIYNIPRWIEFFTKARLDKDSCGKSTRSQAQIRQVETNTVIVIAKQIHFWANPIVMNIVPIVTLVLLNTLIIKKIHEKNRRRESLSTTQIKDIKLSQMLITVVTVFLGCNLLRLVNVIMDSVWRYNCSEVVALSNVLVTLNSSVNYLIYCAYGKKFRDSFIRLFSCCKTISPILNKIPRVNKNNFPVEEIKISSLRSTQASVSTDK